VMYLQLDHEFLCIAVGRQHKARLWSCLGVRRYLMSHVGVGVKTWLRGV